MGIARSPDPCSQEIFHLISPDHKGRGYYFRMNDSNEENNPVNSVTKSAPAKINIGLRVLGKRADGYHEIQTIFQRLTLHDSITVSRIQSGVEYDGARLTAEPADNLCVRAAHAFKRKFDIDQGVRIVLEKNIPVGAGLGGGSSDAAATILAMTELYDIHPSRDELLSLAGEIGSDVPFFTLNTSAALASGRGEFLTPISGLGSNLSLLIIYPEFEVSTTWAYTCIDKHLTLEKNNNNLIIREFLKFQGEIPTANMGNDFEFPVFEAHPELSRERDRLLNAGAIFAMLSGSGSSLYGVFDDEAIAREAALDCPNGLSFVCRPY